MTFREKINKILITNTLNLTSINGIEEYLQKKVGMGAGAVAKFYRSGEDPGGKTTRKILEGIGIRREWWDTGQEPIYEQNSNMSEVAPNELNEVYRNLVEANSDYRLVPKTILDQEYRIVLKTEIDDKRKMMEITLKAKDETIRMQADIIHSLQAQLGRTQEAQK